MTSDDSCHLTRRAPPLEPRVYEVLCVVAAALLAVDGVPGGEGSRGHVAAHVAEADEAERAS